MKQSKAEEYAEIKLKQMEWRSKFLNGISRFFKNALQLGIITLVGVGISCLVFIPIGILIDDHKKLQTAVQVSDWAQFQYETNLKTDGMNRQIDDLKSRIEKLENPPQIPSEHNIIGNTNVFNTMWNTNIMLTSFCSIGTGTFCITNQAYSIIALTNCTFYDCSNAVRVAPKKKLWWK